MAAPCRHLLLNAGSDHPVPPVANDHFCAILRGYSCEPTFVRTAFISASYTSVNPPAPASAGTAHGGTKVTEDSLPGDGFAAAINGGVKIDCAVAVVGNEHHPKRRTGCSAGPDLKAEQPKAYRRDQNPSECSHVSRPGNDKVAMHGLVRAAVKSMLAVNRSTAVVVTRHERCAVTNHARCDEWSACAS